MKEHDENKKHTQKMVFTIADVLKFDVTFDVIYSMSFWYILADFILLCTYRHPNAHL